MAPSMILPFTDPNKLLVRVRINPGGETHLYAVNLKEKTLQDHGAIDGDPADFAWYERDHNILLRKRENGLENVWKYDLDKKKLTQLTFGAGPDQNPMPDDSGHGIYYVSGRVSGVLIRYDTKTGRVNRIIEEMGSQPVISPDGKIIMFVKFARGNAKDELWIAPTDGTSQGVRISEGNTMGTGDWTRDSSRFVFMDGNKPFIGSTDGRNVRPLKPMSANVNNAIWSPDGKSIYIFRLETSEIQNVRSESFG